MLPTLIPVFTIYSQTLFLKDIFLSFAMVNGIISTIKSCLAFLYISIYDKMRRSFVRIIAVKLKHGRSG